jgi:predicted ATPase
LRNGGWRNGFTKEQLNVPPAVRLVIRRALDRLQEGTRHVLRVAAIAGRLFSVRLLEALESSYPNAVLDALDEAQDPNQSIVLSMNWSGKHSLSRCS